jgi:hypothetical protein
MRLRPADGSGNRKYSSSLSGRRLEAGPAAKTIAGWLISSRIVSMAYGQASDSLLVQRGSVDPDRAYSVEHGAQPTGLNIATPGHDLNPGRRQPFVAKSLIELGPACESRETVRPGRDSGPPP